MSQSVALADQLDKRSKELDAREAYLTAREQIAEATEAQISKGQHELSLLDATIVARELILKQQQDRSEAQEKLYVSNELKLKLAREKQQDKLSLILERCDVAKAELEATNRAISERALYQKQQEELIARQSEEGNVKLRGLEYEIIESNQVIKDLGVKKRNIYQESQQLEGDLDNAHKSFEREIAEHEAAILVIVQRTEVVQEDEKSARESLQEANTELADLQGKKQQVIADTDAKLQILDIKEREILAKREAMEKELTNLEEAKHYYKSPQSLYDTI